MFKHSNPNDMSKRDKYSSSKKRLYSCNEPKKPTKLNLFLFTKNNFASKLSLEATVMLAQPPRRSPKD